MSGSSLNEQQYQAVHYRGGALLVLAGAGSGKTRVITERIATLIERHVPQDAITAVTFTNKAAKEMRARLNKRLGVQSKRLRICTFHALGLNILRENPDLVARRDGLSVFSGAEQRSAMRSVLADLQLPTDTDQMNRVLQQVSLLKNETLGTVDATITHIKERYDTLLTRMNAVDFDDLIVLPLQLLTDHAQPRALWQSRARHFLVDEYQDSSRMQYRMVQLLATAEGNLTAVGDDDQSIYGWRGAEVRNLFQLEKDYPNLHTIRLEENYRSTAAILSAANTLIAHNKERLGKSLRSNLGQGKPVRVWACPNVEEDGRRIAGDIKARRAVGEAKDWDDFCILYRASYQSRPVELALREVGIPYHVSGGMSFFDRAEVLDLLAYLRLLANPADDLAFMRAIARPRRGVGDKALGLLADFAWAHECSLLESCTHDDLTHRLADTLRSFGLMIADLDHQFLHGEPDNAFDTLLKNTGLEAAIRHDADDEDVAERRIANVMELRRWWLRSHGSGIDLTAFLQQLSLFADRNEDDPEGRVRLMTVHAAKGLEFDHVYITGAEDGVFPHKNALEENRQEEERRLMYVAVTRARFRLTLSHIISRRRFGKEEKGRPSPFLKEMNNDALRWVDDDQHSDEAKEEAESHMAAMRDMLAKFSKP
ncbi:MAG: UvrD-helicase domain-containing protein [Mariprofundaceae bacterium]|nr:UvrD-helicase domain-containing protein [Mariprofundaceae bacterium]